MLATLPLQARETGGVHRVSVIVPARNEASGIAGLVRAVRAQASEAIELEVIVADDGSSDGTAGAARDAGAQVLHLPPDPTGGNPAVARNRAARVARGDILVFLDADCRPADGWLATLLEAHAGGATIVGGSLELPRGLPWSARCDYYCGWYHVHARRPAGEVSNHPPGNLSVLREAFLAGPGFTERHPIAYAHEELEWQATLRDRGHAIRFEPRAVVYHYNRPGFGNLLRRNYRWAYCAIETKAQTRAARASWIYRFPRTLIVASLPLAVPQALYITWCWVRAGVLEPLLLLPAVLAARAAYALGMVAGGVAWLRRGHGPAPSVRPRWE